MTQENSQHGHVFRRGRFRRVRAYWLDGAVLHWRIGAKRGHVQLADIVSMRLHLPANPATAAKCVLVERSGRVHRIGNLYWPEWSLRQRRLFGGLERRDATFRGLTFTLARRLAKANPDARLLAGPGWGEWIATGVVAALAVAMIVGGAGLMLFHGRLEPAPLAFLLLLAVYLPLLWPVIRDGGPKPLDPSSLQIADPVPDPSPK